MLILNPAPKFKLIGHRGTAGLRPENTLCSFTHAAELGLNWIEFDVQLTSDNQWAVMHDETIDRTTNGHGKICDYTLAELSQFEAGLWYQPTYPKQAIPTLLDTVKLAAKLNLQMNIEIKGATDQPQKYADKMASFLAQYANLFASLPLVSSFDTEAIIALRKLLPNLPIAYLIDNFTEETIAIAQQHNFTSINCNVKTITEQDLALATKNQIPVLLYTVNEPALAKLWLERGVTAIFTDRPDKLL